MHLTKNSMPSLLSLLLIAIAACSGQETHSRAQEYLPNGADKAQQRSSTVPNPPENYLTFAFYNLENLFDTEDDPTNSGDDEFTPGGANQFTEERLERKMGNLARAIRAINEYRGPDLLGVCEIENRRVLEILTQEYLPQGVYSIVHAESPDTRGIDVGILYRAAELKHVRTTMHRVDLGNGRPTRDIMEATFQRQGKAFTVLVNHWPSRLGGEEESEPRRISAAETAARIIDSLRAIDPSADIVMMGDFNDEPRNRAIHDVLDARAYDGSGAFKHRMVNTAAPVEEEGVIGSYFYKKDWELIDQILLSPGVLDEKGLVLYETAETVFAPDFLRDRRADADAGPPFRTYKNKFFIGGTSDHFPVVLRVGWK